MSMESAVQFVQKIGEDESFKACFEAATSPEEVIQIASQAGYDISMEELKKVAGKLRGELLEEQLESVAGGLSNATSKLQKPENTNGIIAILIGM